MEIPCSACHKLAVQGFGDRAFGAELTWWVGVSCEHCGMATEADGGDALPDDLRAIELRENGTWGVVVRHGPTTVVLARLRALLSLSLSEAAKLKRTLPGPLCPGTQAEAQRVSHVLAQAGVICDVVCIEPGEGPSDRKLVARVAARAIAEHKVRTEKLSSAWKAITERRCPHCAQPCPEFRRTCAFCGEHVGRQ